jgi:hypothetical protein
MNETQDWKGQGLGTTDTGYVVKTRVDDITKAQRVITSDHEAVHDGKVFSVSGIYDAVATSTSVNFAFKTPTVASGKIIHLKYLDIMSSADKVRMDLYETSTEQSAGVDITAYNHNRLGTPTGTAMQAIKSGITFESTGATMLNWQRVSKNIQPTEWELCPNKWYIFLFTNQSGSAVDISHYTVWIEEQG